MISKFLNTSEKRKVASFNIAFSYTYIELFHKFITAGYIRLY